MLDMSKIKAVCFDFDAALCHWREYDRDRCPAKRQKCAEEGKNYYDTLGTDGKPWFTKYDFMQLFIDRYCKGLPCFLLSACEEYAQQMKVDWVERNYLFNIENRCVVKVRSKLPMLFSIATELGVEPSEILLVDDNVDDVIFAAFDEGFSTATPTDVAQFLFDSGAIKES